MKIAVISNPTAGFKRTPWHEPVRRKLAELGEVEFITPDTPQGTSGAARDAEARGCSLIIAAGGDGTVHRVINGFTSFDTELGILPVGTANDLSNYIGVPESAIGAADAIVQGGIRPIDTVNINVDQSIGGGVRLHTVAGFFLTADAAMRADRMKRRWPWLGPGVYKIGAAISIAIHGGKKEVGALIANQPKFGGNLRIPGISVIDDGCFEVVTFHGGSRIRLARALTAMSAGKPLPRGAITSKSVAATTIEFEHDVEWFADGEGYGHGRRFDLKVEHKALKIRGART
jgi:diacylglycerol kinase (ATP)